MFKKKINSKTIYSVRTKFQDALNNYINIHKSVHTEDSAYWLGHNAGQFFKILEQLYDDPMIFDVNNLN